MERDERHFRRNLVQDQLDVPAGTVDADGVDVRFPFQEHLHLDKMALSQQSHRTFGERFCLRRRIKEVTSPSAMQQDVPFRDDGLDLGQVPSRSHSRIISLYSVQSQCGRRTGGLCVVGVSDGDLHPSSGAKRQTEARRWLATISSVSRREVDAESVGKVMGGDAEVGEGVPKCLELAHADAVADLPADDRADRRESVGLACAVAQGCANGRTDHRRCRPSVEHELQILLAKLSRDPRRRRDGRSLSRHRRHRSRGASEHREGL